MTNFKYLFLSGLMLGFCPVGHAQDGLSIDVEFQACMIVEDATLRFTCYEDLAEDFRHYLAVLGQANISSNTPEVREEISHDEGAIIDSFGKPEEIAVIPVDSGDIQALTNFDGDGPRMAMREDGSQELQDRIAQLSFKNRQMWEITLEGGQIWRQTVSKRYNLKEGALVKVYQSAWGKSFRLEMEGRGGFIQVKRVK